MKLKQVVVERIVDSFFFYIRDFKDISKLDEIKSRLQRLSEKSNFIHAESDQLVALVDETIFKRAVVVKSDNGGYHCWLLDYGVYITTDRVYKLPEELCSTPPTIKIATLNNVVGLHNVFNFETNKNDTIWKPYFSSVTERFIEKKLSEAKKVYFSEEHTFMDMLCGNFIFEMTDGVTLNLGSLLLEEGHVMVDSEKFLGGLQKSTQKIPVTIKPEEEEDFCPDEPCQLEGIGRGRSRPKLSINKKRDVDNWLNCMDKSLTQDEECSVKDQDSSLNRSFLSDYNPNIDDSSHMLASTSSTSMNANISSGSINLESKSPSKKSGGRGELLKKLSCEVNKQDVQKDFNLSTTKIQCDDLNPSEGSKIKNKSISPCELRKILSNFKQKSLKSEATSLKSDLKTQSNSDSNFSKSSKSSSSSSNRKIVYSTDTISSSSEANSVISHGVEPIDSSDHGDLKGVVMKNNFDCKCENCKKFFDDDPIETRKVFADEVKVVDNFVKGKPLLLLKTELNQSEIKILKNKNRYQTKIEKDMSPNLLIHSPGQLPDPIANICSVPFVKPIHHALTRNQFKTPKSIQMYMWPILMRTMNACIINNQDTGKTMCYLPALLSFLMQKDERYPFLPKEPSPIAVILMDSIKGVEKICYSLDRILDQTKKNFNIMSLVPPMDDTSLNKLKKADLIVSTPIIFTRILMSRIINLKRLCHLVIENIDKILEQTPQELTNIAKATQSMLEHRIFVNTVHMVMTSIKWTIPLENFIKSMESTPVICIGSHLESAIYAKANIEIHFIKQDEKRKRIVAMLKQYSKDLKTVIVCNNDEEVDELERYFQIMGISVISSKRSSNKEEIVEKEILWMSTPMNNNSVLISTYCVLESELSITTAQILIHYSLPEESWSSFGRSFKSVIDTHDSPFNTKFNRSEAVKIHIFVDETCSKQFPRLYYFLRQMKTILPDNFKQFCQEVERDEESLKIENNVAICERLKLMGECKTFRCKKRHLFSAKLDLSEDVPNAGIIKFKVLNVADVTRFGIKVLEWWGTDKNKLNVRDYTNLVTKELYKCVTANKTMVTDVQVGRLYVYFDAKEVTYHRCVVLKILTRLKITNAADRIKIKLIDGGVEKKDVGARALFELAPEYLDVPPQSLEGILANIVPLERDTEWNFRSKLKAEKILNSAIEKYPNSYFVAKIVLQVGETLWLEDLLMREDISSSKEVVTLLSFKKKLSCLDIVDFDESVLQKLKGICAKSGLDLPCYDIDNSVKSTTKCVQQIKPQWAYLDTQPDIFNVVYFSHAFSPEKFYVKLEKYFDLYLQLEDEIQAAIKKPFYPENEQVIVGNCYLGKDSGSTAYNRVLITEINDEIATCFFVDFGDVAEIHINDLKYLSNEHISKLPFQAIECELYGILPITETWQKESSDVLYKYCFLPDTDIFRNLLVNVIDSKSTNYSTKYSVALLDNYDNKQTFINKILIDCGFAIDNKTAKLEDVILPSLNFNEDDDQFSSDDENENIANQKYNISDDDIKKIDEIIPDKNDVIEDEDEMYADIDRCSFLNGGWDFCCTDFRTFMKEITQNSRVKPTPKKTSTSQDSNFYIPIKAASQNFYAPQLLWYQTKTQIFLDIQLENVENFTALVLKKKVFVFKTILNEKEYVLNLSLFNNVSNLIKKDNNGRSVKVVLTKIEEKEWDKLVDTNEKMRNIKYDFNKLKDEEIKKRKFLDLGLDDDDESDENLPLYYNLSSEESDSDSENCDDVR
ncbi:putative ATP-dependent RNA helicase TDRD12 [Onthophagus taurus]|uniref:putative ATP-dependent RNA helicase TDRD12 n=1 Tax=Onthophagus taurus TaxID=166361 RepID=UPI0039BE4B71